MIQTDSMQNTNNQLFRVALDVQSEFDEKTEYREPDAMVKKPVTEVGESEKLENQDYQSRLNLEFGVDKVTKDIIINLVDSDTNETVRSIPTEREIKIKEQIDNLLSSSEEKDNPDYRKGCLVDIKV